MSDGGACFRSLCREVGCLQDEALGYRYCFRLCKSSLLVRYRCEGTTNWKSMLLGQTRGIRFSGGGEDLKGSIAIMPCLPILPPAFDPTGLLGPLNWHL